MPKFLKCLPPPTFNLLPILLSYIRQKISIIEDSVNRQLRLQTTPVRVLSDKNRWQLFSCLDVRCGRRSCRSREKPDKDPTGQNSKPFSNGVLVRLFTSLIGRRKSSNVYHRLKDFLFQLFCSQRHKIWRTLLFFVVVICRCV